MIGENASYIFLLRSNDGLDGFLDYFMSIVIFSINFLFPLLSILNLVVLLYRFVSSNQSVIPSVRIESF